MNDIASPTREQFREQIKKSKAKVQNIVEPYKKFFKSEESENAFKWDANLCARIKQVAVFAIQEFQKVEKASSAVDAKVKLDLPIAFAKLLSSNDPDDDGNILLKNTNEATMSFYLHLFMSLAARSPYGGDFKIDVTHVTDVLKHFLTAVHNTTPNAAADTSSTTSTQEHDQSTASNKSTSARSVARPKRVDVQLDSHLLCEFAAVNLDDAAAERKFNDDMLKMMQTRRDLLFLQ